MTISNIDLSENPIIGFKHHNATYLANLTNEEVRHLLNLVYDTYLTKKHLDEKPLILLRDTSPFYLINTHRLKV